MNIFGLFLVIVAVQGLLWLMCKCLAPKDDNPPERFWILKGLVHHE